LVVFGGKQKGAVLGQEIEKALYSVEILAYIFLAPRSLSKPGMSTDLFNTLVKKISEGVNILLLCNDKFPQGWLKKRSELERKRLRSVGVTVRTYPRHTILHSKLILIDRRVALLGSMNLTAESMTNNHELLVKIDDKPCIEKLSAIFYNAWTESKGGG